MLRLPVTVLATLGLAAAPAFACDTCAAHNPVSAEATDSHAHGESEGHSHEGHGDPFIDVTELVCVLVATEGNRVSGTVTFTQTEDGVRVRAEVDGLTPNQLHGFHIHQFGDLTRADGTSAGGHYNPDGVDHALPGADVDSHEGHGDHGHEHGHDGHGDEDHGDHGMHAGHAGDLGNLEADGDGHASYDATFDNITLAGAVRPILGRGIIVHRDEDDGGQPTGNAGPRIAMGVIGVAMTED